MPSCRDDMFPWRANKQICCSLRLQQHHHVCWRIFVEDLLSPAPASSQLARRSWRAYQMSPKSLLCTVQADLTSDALMLQRSAPSSLPSYL
jgi:hypothetical protein